MSSSTSISNDQQRATFAPRRSASFSDDEDAASAKAFELDGGRSSDDERPATGPFKRPQLPEGVIKKPGEAAESGTRAVGAMGASPGLGPTAGNEVYVALGSGQQAASILLDAEQPWAALLMNMSRGERARFEVATAAVAGGFDFGPLGPADKSGGVSLELLGWARRQDVLGDGRFWASMLTKADGCWQQPKAGDEVTVSLALPLALFRGSVAFQTQDVNRLASFSLDDGVEGIGAPLAAFLKMLVRGQTARLSASRKLLRSALTPWLSVAEAESSGGDAKMFDDSEGYAGSDEEVAAATLQLREIHEIKDVSLISQEGRVSKKRLNEGEGWETPRLGASVVLELEAAAATGAETPVELTCVLGQGAVCDALEGALLHMLQKERAEISTVHDEEWAPGTCPDAAEGVHRALGVLPGGRRSLRLRLCSFTNPASLWDLSASKVEAWAEARKKEGSDAYSRKRVRLAWTLYRAAVEALDEASKRQPLDWSSGNKDGGAHGRVDNDKKDDDKKDDDKKDDDKDDDQNLLGRGDGKPVAAATSEPRGPGSAEDRAKELSHACRLNVAACLLKLERFAEALDACENFLRDEPANFKALLRGAAAAFQLGRFAPCVEYLTRALEVAPTSVEARALMTAARAALRKQRARDQRVCARMMAGLGGAA